MIMSPNEHRENINRSDLNFGRMPVAEIVFFFLVISGMKYLNRVDFPSLIAICSGSSIDLR